MTAAPGGCQHCGLSEREHGQRWKPSAGWHTWAQPTGSQILARMKARRAARVTNSPKGKPMGTMPPALATIAALHTLLTNRPSLAELPIRWTVKQNGDLHASPEYLTDGSLAAVRALAEAIDAKVYEYTVPDSDTGGMLRAVSIYSAKLTEASVASNGYELVPAELIVAEDGAL